MRYRTDLALETMENLEEAGIIPGEADGVIVRKETAEEHIRVTEIEVTGVKGEVLLRKPRGKYVTIEIDGLLSDNGELSDKAAHVLAGRLKKMVRHHYHMKVLAVGLGNSRVTPDSLGPLTVSKIKVTRHLFEIFDCDGDEEYGNVAAMAPGVKGTTGIETADIIKKLTEIVKPEAVIIIDSLAAGSIGRVSTTIQLSDTGISPGAGMGNKRKSLSERDLGVKVISVGVPTVIDTRNLLGEAFQALGVSGDKREKYFAERDLDMIVTSTDIDIVLQYFSDIISKGVNITLHPGIYF